jgi:hypothetical protein
MDEAKRWFNDLFFASVYTNFRRPEIFTKGSIVIAEDEDNFRVMRQMNLFTKYRKLIEHVLCASGTSMKEIACDQKSACSACLHDASKSLEVLLC